MHCLKFHERHNMHLKKQQFFHSVNMSIIPRFLTGKKLDIWDNSQFIINYS